MWLVSFFRRHNRRLLAGWATLVAVAVSPTHSSSAESFDAPAIRWHDTDAMPLRVWVQPASRVVGSGTQLGKSVRVAVAAWSSAAPLEFAFSSDSVTADVRVYWSEGALLSYNDRAVNALTHCEVDENSRIVRADIVVAARQANGRTLTPESLNALVMHEVGHAIGLEHSPDSSSIMFATVRVNGLSNADIAAVRARYPESIGTTPLDRR